MKSISRNTTHLQFYNLQAMLTGVKRRKPIQVQRMWTTLRLQSKNRADPTATNKGKPKRFTKLHTKGEVSKLTAW